MDYGDSFLLSSLFPKNVSVDELRKLLSDKDAYQNLLYSLEPVKTQTRVSCCSDCYLVPILLSVIRPCFPVAQLFIFGVSIRMLKLTQALIFLSSCILKIL